MSATANVDPRARMLLDASIGRTLLKLAAPNIMVMVARASVGLIEAYFVGRLGVDALAGMALVFGLGVSLVAMAFALTEAIGLAAVAFRGCRCSAPAWPCLKRACCICAPSG